MGSITRLIFTGYPAWMAQPANETKSQRHGTQSVTAHLAMCAATAVLLTLAFPLPGWSFMAFFALVPVGVLVMRTRRIWTLAWTSYVVFFAWWALRVLWLRHVGGFAPIGIALVCATWFTVALVGLTLVQRRFKAAMTLTLPIFWCAQEIVRCTWPFGGFAWFTLGTSQAAWRVGEHPGYLVQSADLFGWVTVSFLVAMTSGLIVDLIARPVVKRFTSGKLRPRRTILFALLLWSVSLGSAMVYGHQRISNTPGNDLPGTEVVLGIVQTNVAQNNKIRGTLEQKQQDFDRMIEISEMSAADFPKPALIVWPETMVTFPVNDEMIALSQEVELKEPYDTIIPALRERIQSHSDRFGIPLMFGGQARGFREHDKTMNSALFVTPGGDSFGRYSKMHLVPVGEYVPGPQWFREQFFKYFSPYDYDYTVQPGESIVIFEVDGRDEPLRVATPICYEDAVAMQCRKMVYGNDGNKRVDLLLNLTNEGWYMSNHQRFQHLQLAVMRCIENRVPMARSVNTGVSGVIDSAGRVGPLVTEGGENQDVDGYVNAAVTLDPRVTVYGRVREGAWVGICVTALLLLLGVLVPSTSGRQK
jgi:apolipoprotein N-acyltransferase